MLRKAGSALFWGFGVLSAVVLLPGAVLLWLVEAPFGRRRPVLHLYCACWASLITLANPLWPVTVRGRERIDRRATYVIVSNHLSLLDILVISRLRTHYVWVSKAENFRIPVIGWAMRMNAYIPLQRGDRESVAQMMELAEGDLRAGSSIVLFPEGTRSRDGRLQPFRLGAFELAVRTGSAVLPLVLSGTGDALPRRGFVLQGRHPITLDVLEPVPVQPGESPAELADRVRAAYAERLPV